MIYKINCFCGDEVVFVFDEAKATLVSKSTRNCICETTYTIWTLNKKINQITHKNIMLNNIFYLRSFRLFDVSSLDIIFEGKYDDVNDNESNEYIISLFKKYLDNLIFI